MAVGHPGKGSAGAEQLSKAVATLARPASVVPAAGPIATNVFVKIPSDSTATIGTFPAFKIVATCNRSGGFERFQIEPLVSGVDLQVTGKGNNGPIVVGGKGGAAISLNESAPIRNERGISTFSAARPDERAVVGTLGYDAMVSIDDETVCTVYGKVVS